jgi:protein SCO1/2
MADLSRRKALGFMGLAPAVGGVLSAGVMGAKRTDNPDARKESAPSAPEMKAASRAAREKIRQRYLPNVTLYTQDNKRVLFYDDLVKDKVVTLNFFYAKCEGVCPAVTANLVKVQKLLGSRVGRDLFMYSFTLKPEEDGPAELKEYQEMHGIGPGWSLLTGKPADIELLRKSLGFTYPDPRIDKDKSQHIGNIRYGNEPLMLWSACPGMAHAQWIAESISWVIRS